MGIVPICAFLAATAGHVLPEELPDSPSHRRRRPALRRRDAPSQLLWGLPWQPPGFRASQGPLSTWRRATGKERRRDPGRSKPGTPRADGLDLSVGEVEPVIAVRSSCRRACPSLGWAHGHNATVFTRGHEKWACPPGERPGGLCALPAVGHAPRSGLRMDTNPLCPLAAAKNGHVQLGGSGRWEGVGAGRVWAAEGAGKGPSRWPAPCAASQRARGRLRPGKCRRPGLSPSGWRS